VLPRRLRSRRAALRPEGPRGYPALRAFLEPHHGRLRLAELKRGLALPEVCVPGTRFACLFEPQSLLAHLRPTAVASAPAPDGSQGWTRVDLLEQLSLEAQARYAPTPPVTDIGPVRVEKMPLSIGAVELSAVELQSPAPSGFATNDRIRGVFYRPAAPKGAVIALPAWKESNLAGQGLLALALAKEGYAVLVMPLPYQVDRALEGRGSGEWTFSADLARTRAAFLQGAADVARASLWLEEQGFAARHQAVMGVSLGGHVAALAYGAYPERFGAGVFLLAGGDVSTALLTENRTTGRIRRALLERGVTSEEAVPLMRVVDDATWATPARGAGVLVVGAEEDDVVPPANVRALAAAYGNARLEWLEGDHYGILRQLPKTIAWVVDHLGKAAR
jgi:dienelactone hydrolase